MGDENVITNFGSIGAVGSHSTGRVRDGFGAVPDSQWTELRCAVEELRAVIEAQAHLVPDVEEATRAAVAAEQEVAAAHPVRARLARSLGQVAAAAPGVSAEVEAVRGIQDQLARMR